MGNPLPRVKRPASLGFVGGAFLSLFLVTGCGGPTGDRVPVSGEVTLDGQPLDRGSIEFHPDGEGTLTGGMIVDGTFEIPAAQGAEPGNYSVRIFASGESVEGDPEAGPGPEAENQVAEELIPAKFNTETELTAEIGEQGADSLRFEVTSK